VYSPSHHFLDHVDVNVTPDKRKVILQQEKALLLLVKGSLHKIYRSMQGEYEATSVGRQPGPGILASGDQKVSPRVPLSPPPPPPPTSLWSRLPSLKRPSSHEDSENGAHYSSSPRPKQPKLSDYGIEKRENGHSHETRNKDEESFCHRDKSSVSASPFSPSCVIAEVTATACKCVCVCVCVCVSTQSGLFLPLLSLFFTSTSYLLFCYLCPHPTFRKTAEFMT
jgi:DNA mismatch repair ATPase MutL